MKKYIKNIWGTVLKIYDRLTSTVVTASIGDILMSHPQPDFISFVFASRHLDASHYLSGEDRTFKYTHGISSKFQGVNYSHEKGEKKFIDLIESFSKRGYDPTSLLVMDKGLNLDNGTHRLALCLLNDIYNVKVKVVRRKAIVKKNIDLYYNVGIESGLLSDINNEYHRIYNHLIDSGHAFICRLEGDVKNIAEDIKKDLAILGGCTNVKLLQETDNQIKYSFSIANPCYSIDYGWGGQLRSERALEIEKVLMKRYKDRNVTINVSKNCVRNEID